MHKAIICTSVSLFLACAPSLSDGEGARCSAALACDEGFSCYRGFCLPDSESVEDSSAPVRVDELQSDAGAPVADAAGGTAPSASAASPSSAAPTSAPPASAAPAPSGESNAASKPAPAPKPNDNAAARPPAASAASDAGAPPPDTGAPVADAGTRPNVDAAVPASDAGAPPVLDPAALLDALGLPVDCSLMDCCKEAQRAVERVQKGEEEKPENSGKCGCENSQLFSTLVCSAVL